MIEANVCFDHRDIHRLATEAVDRIQRDPQHRPKAARRNITTAMLFSHIRQMPEPKYLVLPSSPHHTPTGSAIGIWFTYQTESGLIRYHLCVYVRKGKDAWALYQLRLRLATYADSSNLTPVWARES